MAIKLNAATGGGSVALDAPNSTDSNANVVLTLPTNDGDSGQYLQTNGSGTLSWQTVTDTTTNLTRSTAVDTTSGTEIDFTGIPSGVRRITILLNRVSTNGTEYMKILIGDSGGFEETDYYSISGQTFSSNGNAHEASNGFTTTWGSTAGNRTGAFFLHNLTGNMWVFSGMHSGEDGVNKGVVMTGGRKSLSGELTQIRITQTGSNTFDNGNVNIFYEV